MKTLEQKAKKSAYMREYLRENYEKINSDRRKRYLILIDTKKTQAKRWRENNKELKAQIDKDYQEKNKEKIALNKRNYYLKNRAHLIKVNCERSKNRRKTDILFNLKSKLRTQIIVNLAKRKYKKSLKTEELLGARIEVVREHIESLFKEGMTWQNHGTYGWHIDHKTPLASAKSEQDVLELFHYTNLQPLWAKDNLMKGGRTA